MSKFEDMINTIQLGDSQELLPHILEKLDRNKVILVSDPPFNVGYHYNSYKDNLDEDEYFEVLESIFGEDKCVLIITNIVLLLQTPYWNYVNSISGATIGMFASCR